MCSEAPSVTGGWKGGGVPQSLLYLGWFIAPKEFGFN